MQEAQIQRKLAVQEFTDVNEKVNELRSKNYKLTNDLLNREDEIEDLKRCQNENKLELERRDKLIEDLKQKIDSFIDSIGKLENEKLELLQKHANE